MKDIFSYDSKFSIVLRAIADWMILNIIYLITCIPLITVGAAGAGLMNAARVIQDKNRDESYIKAYFRGFRAGFVRITVIWAVLLIIAVFMLYILGTAVYVDGSLDTAPVICAVVALIAVMLLQSMAVAFHSQFDCSIMQILRSALLMTLMHPFRAIAMALLIWAPVLIALLDSYVFLQLLPIWVMLYYGASYQACVLLMKKPFQKVKEQFFPDLVAEELSSDTAQTSKCI